MILELMFFLANIQVRIDLSGWFERDIVKEAFGFDTHTKKKLLTGALQYRKDPRINQPRVIDSNHFEALSDSCHWGLYILLVCICIYIYIYSQNLTPPMSDTDSAFRSEAEEKTGNWL